MRSWSSEHDLIEAFGTPNERKAIENTVLLRWKTEAWSADAMFSDGQLQIAGAYAHQSAKAKKKQLEDHPAWKIGETKLQEMEAALGPGTRVGVQWHKGIEVARSIRNRPDFDRSVLNDRCSQRYAWANLEMGSFSSLRFSDDGVLQGAL